MVFGNGNGKKPALVQEVRGKYVPPKPALDDYKPESHRIHVDPDIRHYVDPDIRHEPPDYLQVTKMNDLAKEIERDRIREVALLVSVLTYGEVVKYEEGLKGAGAPADLDLKPILHKWALDYLKKDDPHD